MSRVRVLLVLPAVAAAALLAAPAAFGAERLLTLYSPEMTSLPYVHKVYTVGLRPDGEQAPAEPGYITGIKEQVLVDSKDPKAKRLPIGKMMVHHFLYFAPGRVEDKMPGTCFNGLGFIAGRGEEHPSGQFGRITPSIVRDRYGIPNRKADGTAPGWVLTAMVMNHYKRAKKFMVRTKVWYTTEPREAVQPIVVGDCSKLGNGMSYDVPGGGRPGSTFVNGSTWTVPADFNGRILLAASHQHGGGEYHTLSSLTCHRRLFKSPTYYGPPDHIYNTIRPILHEPGPVANGTFGTLTGVPISAGEVLERRAVHDNANLHVAAMGFWVLFVKRDDSVARCAPMPRDVVELTKPRRYDHTPNYGRVVPQLAKPTGSLHVVSDNPLTVGDEFFSLGRVVARRGQVVTWRFTGAEPHSVTVANGPRGFSSVYWGTQQGQYSFRPTVPGVYRLTCLIHPTTMGQTLVVR
jgi:plastocyanin